MSLKWIPSDCNCIIVPKQVEYASAEFISGRDLQKWISSFMATVVKVLVENFAMSPKDEWYALYPQKDLEAKIKSANFPVMFTHTPCPKDKSFDGFDCNTKSGLHIPYWTKYIFAACPIFIVDGFYVNETGKTQCHEFCGIPTKERTFIWLNTANGPGKYSRLFNGYIV